MHIIIQTLHFTAKPDLDAHVNDKVNRLEHFYDKIESANVTLKIEPHDDGDKLCEIRLAIPGNDLFVKKHAASFEEAVTRAVDVLEEQIHRLKGKR
ncbi:MAG TPA: ribosome-associated translation inhibitor RaiA [Chitinophagales bacterium]|nr:ribosome-associated translation inhibitor RaiA [Chitinophagales bacterium]